MNSCNSSMVASSILWPLQSGIACHAEAETLFVRGSWRLCVISRSCCCAYRQSGSDTEKRDHVAITAVHHAMQKVPRAVRRAGRSGVRERWSMDGGREGLTPLHAAGRGLATCALMARPLRGTSTQGSHLAMQDGTLHKLRSRESGCSF